VSPGRLDGSGIGLARESFEFGEDLLDGIEIGTIGRQEEEARAGGANGRSDCLSLVTAEIVHDHDIAGLQHRPQHLLDISQEARAVDGTVDHARSGHLMAAKSRQHGESAPPAIGNFGKETLPFGRTAVAACHVGLGPGLVDKH